MSAAPPVRAIRTLNVGVVPVEAVAGVGTEGSVRVVAPTTTAGVYCCRLPFPPLQSRFCRHPSTVQSVVDVAGTVDLEGEARPLAVG